jgi:hypothetical protein
MSQFFIATSIYWKVRYIGQKYGKTNKKDGNNPVN